MSVVRVGMYEETEKLGLAAGFNTVLMELSLRDNRIDAAQGSTIAEALLFNTTLTKLDLGKNVM